MVASGPRSGTTFAVKTAYYDGGVTWTNVTRLSTSDNSYATSGTLSTSDSDAISCTNFGFAIPGTATILGVVCEVECMGAGGTMTINQARLENAGVGIGNTKGNIGLSITSESYKTIGSSSDMWGMSTATLTPAVVNSTTFGFWFKVNGGQGSTGVCSVDHVRVTVHYQLPPTATSVSFYAAGRPATGPSNTPWYVNFTGAGGLTTFQVRTANTTSTGTQVGTGTAADGSNSRPLNYNDPGLSQTNGTTLYLFVSNDSGTTWSPAYNLTFRRDDSIVAPSTISHSPSPIGSNKQYTVNFNLLDSFTTGAFEMTYFIRTGAGGTGTLLQSGQFTQGIGVATSTVTDSTITNGATRYLRCADAANNYSETSFTVTYNPTISSTANLVLPFPIMKAQGAQYAATNFPLNAVPLDDFSGGDDADINGRAASHLPSSIWQSPMPGHSDIVASPAPLAITGGVLHGTSPTLWSSGLLSGVVNRITRPIEIYATHNSWQTNLMWLISNPGVGTTDGYMAAATATDIQVYRLDNGTFTILLTIPSVIQPGWKFGFRHDPSGLISVVSNRGGPNWLLEGTVSDNTYNTGQFGVFLPGPSASNFIDDLAATPVIPGASVLTLPFPVLKAAGTHTTVLPTAVSRLVSPFPSMYTSALQRDIGISRLISPFPILYSAGLHTDIQATSILTLPFPVLQTTALLENILGPYNTIGYGGWPYDSYPLLEIPPVISDAVSLTIPFPMMFAAGMQRIPSTTTRLITPFPVMAASGRPAFKSTSILILPSPVMKSTGLEKGIGISRLINPFPVLFTSGKQRDIGVARLILPAPIMSTTGKQRDIGIARLVLPSPLMVSTGKQRDIATARLISPFPIMYSQGAHYDIQGVSRLIVPFPVMNTAGFVEGGARSYLIAPFPIMSTTGRQRDVGQGRFILPFPILQTAALQRIIAQARLITPFPMMVSSGRSVFKGQGRFILPTPLMYSQGRQEYASQAIILTLPSPILRGIGNVPTQGRAYLILPFPILTATGIQIPPILIIYESTLEIPDYTKVIPIPEYSSILQTPDHSTSISAEPSDLTLPIPDHKQTRSL